MVRGAVSTEIAFSIQHSAVSTQQSAVSSQHSAVSSQHLAVSTWHLAFGQPWPLQIQSTTALRLIWGGISPLAEDQGLNAKC